MTREENRRTLVAEEVPFGDAESGIGAGRFRDPHRQSSSSMAAHDGECGDSAIDRCVRQMISIEVGRNKF